MSDDFGPTQKRESVKMGVSGHSRELSMAEITKFNKGMNNFFKRRNMNYGDGFRGIIGNEVNHANKRRKAAENKARQAEVEATASLTTKKGKKKI